MAIRVMQLKMGWVLSVGLQEIGKHLDPGLTKYPLPGTIEEERPGLGQSPYTAGFSRNNRHAVYEKVNLPR